MSTLGWPRETKDLNYFFPSNVLVTGSDIIFLWVARMIMLGLYTRDSAPFKDVYIAATVCDKLGRKFSKTLGNGIDPIDLIEEYGTDAVRFTGIHLAPLGGRVRMEEVDFESGARFVNKIWNAARFLLNYLPESPDLKILASSDIKLSLADRWLISEFQNTARDVNSLLLNYRVNEAIEKIYHFVWHSFCDWGLECSKDILNGDNQSKKMETLSVLMYVFEGCLRFLSPVMPFITEEIWHFMPRHPDWDRPICLSLAAYPQFNDVSIDQSALKDWGIVQNLVRGVRQIRASLDLGPKESLECSVRCEQEIAALFTDNSSLINRLAVLKSFQIVSSEKPEGKFIIHVDQGFELFIAAEGLIDIEKEQKRLTLEASRIQKILIGLKSKLANKGFTEKAPREVIESVEAQENNLSSQLEILNKNIQSLM